MEGFASGRVRRQYEAAAAGDVTSLLNLVREDSRVLDESIVTGFFTPLHIAAKLGYSGFVAEILNLKPVLARLQDFEGMSPLHLAAANGHLQVVKELISTDPEICLIKDRRGRNPVHISVIRNSVEVLKELVETKPEAALACADNSATVVHLCVNHSRLEALTFLVRHQANMQIPEFVNSKNDDGFNALHLAVAEKQTEIVRYLIERTPIDINMLNAKGYTALDMMTAVIPL